VTSWPDRLPHHQYRDITIGGKNVDAGRSPPPLVKCPSCGETWATVDLEKSTWQQWQCPCCGRWSDKEAG
jgi:hypothetical protein